MQVDQQRLCAGLRFLSYCYCSRRAAPRTRAPHGLAASVFNLAEHDGAQAWRLPDNSPKTRHSTGRGRCSRAKIPAKVAALRGSARLGEARTAGAARPKSTVKIDSQLPTIARARCLASGVRACACLELDWSVNVDQQADRSAFTWSRLHPTTPMSA
jgi:hypothetical protein